MNLAERLSLVFEGILDDFPWPPQKLVLTASQKREFERLQRIIELRLNGLIRDFPKFLTQLNEMWEFFKRELTQNVARAEITPTQGIKESRIEDVRKDIEEAFEAMEREIPQLTGGIKLVRGRLEIILGSIRASMR